MLINQKVLLKVKMVGVVDRKIFSNIHPASLCRATFRGCFDFHSSAYNARHLAFGVIRL